MTTTVYRETRTIDRPASLLARELDAALDGGRGDGDRDDGTDGTGEGDDREVGAGDDPGREWTTTRLRGLYRYRLRLDPAAGRLSVAVAVPEAYRYLAAAAVPVAVAVALVDPPGAVLAALLWGYAALALVPVAHLLPGLVADRPADLPGTTPVGRDLGVHSPLAFAAVATVLLAEAGSPWRPSAATGAAVLVCAVGAGAYSLAGGLSRPATGGRADGRSRFDRDRARIDRDRSRTDRDGRVGADDRDRRGVSALWVALAALSPGLVTTANALVVASVLSDAPSTAGVALAATVVVALDLLVFAYARLSVDRLVEARLVGPGGRRRTLLAVAYPLASVALVGAAGAAVWRLATRPVPGVSTATIGALAALAAVPAVAVLVAWLLHVLRTAAGGLLALTRSRPTEPPAALDSPPELRVVDLGVPVARPVVLPGRRFVLVDRSLVDALDDRQLAAVVAHEQYHLRRRDPATGLGLAAASLLVGGRNAALSLVDYAAVERAADDSAVDRVGADHLVAALRRIEGLRHERGLVGGRGDRGDRGDRSRPRLARDTLTAPYRLLFGSVLVDRAHDDLDDRIERLLAADRSDRGTATTDGVGSGD